MSQVMALPQRSRDLIKKPYLSGDHHFLQKSLREKSLYDRGRRVFHLLVGQVCFGTVDTISTNLLTGKYSRAYLTEALGYGVFKAARIKYAHT